MERVIIESPYAGDVARNVIYARRCMLDALNRGEAPFLSHLLYTQVLDDSLAMQRKLGMEAGLAWTMTADLVAVYWDYGHTLGMDKGIDRATVLGKPLEYRSIGKNPPAYSEGLGDK